MTDRPDTPSVALVVLNWNGRADTLRCLESLAVDADPRLQIVVVDNGSNDGTLEAVAQAHPAVETIALSTNTGFCAGNNVGLRWALDRRFDLIGVLNNDTVADPGFLDPLVAELVADPLAVVSPRIVYLDRPDEAWFGSARIDAEVGIIYHRSEADLPASEVAAPVRAVPAVTGCCLLATRGVWQAVGLFDERFYLIFEDADWSARARAAGCQAEVVTASTVRHAVSASFATTSTAVGDYYYARNGLLYLRHHSRQPRRQSARLLGRLYRESLRRAWHQRDRPSVERIAAQTAGVVDFARGRLGRRGDHTGSALAVGGRP